MSRTKHRGLVFGCAIALLCLTPISTPAQAGPNRCGTSRPDRSPTWVDAAGSHWFDEHGAWTQGPDGSIFGYGGVDLENSNAQVNLWSNDSLQVYVGIDRQCFIVGDIGNAANVGEFSDRRTPDWVPMPWLRRADGDNPLVVADDGRTTICVGSTIPTTPSSVSRRPTSTKPT